MKCPLCETTVAETDVACPGCNEMLSEWRILNGNSQLLRQRGLHLAAQEDLVGACLAFMQAALGDPTDDVSLVDAGRSLILLGRADDAARILQYAHQRSRKSGASDLIKLLKDVAAEEAGAEDAEESDRGASTAAAGTPQGQSDQAETKTGGGPLLQLDLLVQKRSRLSKGVDSLWVSVLRTERQWQQDWSSFGGWLAAACGVDEPHPALVYLRGLDAWQRHEPAEALTQFSRCVTRERKVLNPVAWALYATLLAGRPIDGIAEMASAQVSSKGLRMAIDALSARLQEINSDQSRDALRQLRSVST